MIFREPLNTILGQLSRVKILRFMVKARVESNGREIAKATGLSHVKCHTALQGLALQGFVRMRSSGRSLLYSLEEQNAFVRSVLVPLFENERGIFELLKGYILKGFSAPKPVSIILFGSVARGDALPGSDIDALIVFPDGKNMKIAEKEARKLETDITVAFGNRLSPILMKAGGVARRLKKGSGLIAEVAGEGKLIYGKALSEAGRNGK